MKHLISADDISADEIIELLDIADRLRKQNKTISKQIFAANLFFEPSTRTKMSFFIAERNLGIEAINFQPEHSSITKGESLYDTIKTFEAIGADVFVIRHENDEWANDLLRHLSIPLINAGAGKKNHPTQSLLDVLTIYQEFQQFMNVNVVIAGDIKHSRVAHSSAKMLTKLGANVYMSGAAEHMDKQ